MVIKGSSRGQSPADCRRLADHLLDGSENESVAVLEVRGAVAEDLHGAFAEWKSVSLASRAKKALYHASVNVGRHEAEIMTEARWQESVDELERRLGLTGRPRAVVRHRKRDRDHVHVVWLRVDPLTLKVASDSHNYRRHEEASRELEARFGLDAVVGAHTRPEGTARPVAAAAHKCWQAAERTKMPVAEVAAAIRGAWRESVDVQSFAAALEKRGLSLANGDRGIVVVDRAGTPHSIARRLGIKAAQVKERLTDLDTTSLPTLASRKKNRERKGNLMKKETKRTAWGIEALGPIKPMDWDRVEAWWRERGFDPVREWNRLIIDAYGATWSDYGDRIELHCDGEPTDEQIAAMVRAGRERGWQSVRFYGGSEDFQRRAREEAIRQGYSPDRITLECEEGRKAKEPMPEHLKKALGTPEHAEHQEHRQTEEADHEYADAPRL
ncbi:relaxase/mobilization nuclease domain-containing protein [Caenispirillum bisanense]|uniref:Relaxase/Mobilisation nuclease domain-containing protein n=1 Tax=Caenispirillum bisanense TaxID=414052 RepID=A0A286H247_9PROT|nr:relaxase/mobilization nuclease domain-containing protein [Caenispirillum bisanense]SOE01526.1 Relaxase/Mobilisation nuclease domain-containing protein [Caenispirillum bisanense]